MAELLRAMAAVADAAASPPPSRKRRRPAGSCRLQHAVTGERCKHAVFHEGPCSFDMLDVNADIRAWHRTWPRALALEGADAGEYEGVYTQTTEIVWRRPVYEHEAGHLLCFGQKNSWVVRRATDPLWVSRLQLKDACRTPERSSKRWQRALAGGGHETLPDLRCVLAEEALPLGEAEAPQYDDPARELHQQVAEAAEAAAVAAAAEEEAAAAAAAAAAATAAADAAAVAEAAAAAAAAAAADAEAEAEARREVASFFDEDEDEGWYASIVEGAQPV